MKSLITITVLILSTTCAFADVPVSSAPMSSIKKSISPKCPQMLKGYENAKKLAIPEEQKAKMIESLKKNGCLQ